MAFNPAPSAWLGAGYTVSTGSHTIAFTTNTAGSNKILTQLTDAEADPTTGDIREIIFALMEALNVSYQAQGNDVPVELNIQKSSGVVVAGKVTYTYTVGVNVTILTQNVTPEP